MAQSHLLIRRFDLVTVHERHNMASWCQDHLGYSDWWVDGNTFYFRHSKDALMFDLKWR